MKPAPGLPEIVFAAKDSIWISTPAAPQVVLPLSGETTTISMKPKTAALCYDRVWAASDDVVPAGIRVWGGTEVEQGDLGLAANWNIQTNRAPVAAMIASDTTKSALMRASTEQGLGWTFREIARGFQQQHATPIVPVYDLAKDRETAYKEGQREVIVSVISDLSIVDEQSLTWKQVREFRADQEAREKYRRLLHWLDKEMVGKSQQFVEDEISQKLTGYEWALNKHGMETALGAIEEFLDAKHLLGAEGFSVCMEEPFFATLAIGARIGKVVLTLLRRKLEYADLERGPDSEISWLYDLKKV